MFDLSQSSKTLYRLLVFSTALSVLMFELVISRLADFHLGSGNSYLAIPITFLGLAIGSVHAHLDRRIIERFSVFWHVVALAAVSYAALLGAFGVFGKLLPLVSEGSIVSNKLYTLYKTFAFIGLMAAPFYVFGRILTVCYQKRRDDIGAIYSYDLIGAAIACAVTPLLFHLSGLPTVTLVLLGLVALPIPLFSTHAPRVRAALVVASVVLVIAGQQLIGWFDDSLDYSRFRRGVVTTEVTHAWNAFSRVALIREDWKRGDPSYKIVHDNSRSNVKMRAYDAAAPETELVRFSGLEVPFLLERPVRTALVMLAGCGAEMVRLNGYARGTADLTGVELNPLVWELAVDPRVAQYNLAAFYALPNIHHVTDEGRHFLATTETRFDFIFAGTNAPTGVPLTGHSRKYLDTVEAFSLYLDRLAEGGVIAFDRQAGPRYIQTIKQTFAERGIDGFADKIMVISPRRGRRTLLVSPTGFSEDDVGRVKAFAAKDSGKILYAAGGIGSSATFKRLIEGELTNGKDVVTDDRPFRRGLYLDQFGLIPGAGHLRKHAMYSAWMKVITLIVLTVICALILGFISFRPSTRMPPSALVYLLVTGFCFMLIEVGLMAKLELFLQDPLVSMATVLTVFLLTSGLGSRLSTWLGPRIRMSAYPILVALLTLALPFVLGFLAEHLLTWPMSLRLVVTVLVTAPVGIALGIFYPFLVSCLVKHGHDKTVAITYGVSTLSSVVGATYAMTFMIELGFNQLLLQAAVGYVFLAGFLVVANRVTGRTLLRL